MDIFSHLPSFFYKKINIVGGAGSLYVDENKTVQLIDTPEFPDFVKPTASAVGVVRDNDRYYVDIYQSFCRII